MRRVLFTLVILALLLTPAVAGAVDWIPLVPCGSSTQVPCTPCHLFQTFKNLTDLVLLGMTGPIAAFMIVLAGGMMLLGGGKPALYSKGTTMLKNTLIGVAIILLAWVVTNTLIKSLITTGQGDAWYEFTCPAFLQQPEDAPPAEPVAAQGSPERPAAVLAQASAAYCSPASLAADNNVPVHQPAEYRAPPNTNTSLNAPSLNTLVTCLLQDPVVAALYDKNQLFSYEVSNPLCNLTHGKRSCGSCQHAVSSCHYGGETGNQGAMAVDINYNGRPLSYVIATRTITTTGSEPCAKKPGECRRVSSEEELFDEVYRALDKYNCDYKYIDIHNGHTHLTAPNCLQDGSGVGKGRKAPAIP